MKGGKKMKYEVLQITIDELYENIRNNMLDLQPDFQRGDTWSLRKQEKLIDSILRSWVIPPIYIVRTSNGSNEVLDGQQRLTTIFNFINGEFSIDGDVSPITNDIGRVRGLRYSQLSDRLRRQFREYRLTVIYISQYSAEEISELFNRLNLNETLKLTSAEQRNTFIGEARNQIRRLANLFESYGASRETIGFSNSRMAYDDVIAKLCCYLELNTLRRRITPKVITERYKSNACFSERVYEQASQDLSIFMGSVVTYTSNKLTKNMQVALSKETLLSWLIFVHRNKEYFNQDMLSFYIRKFDYGRKANYYTSSSKITYDKRIDTDRDYLLLELFNIYNEKSSINAGDTFSVIMRDLILNLSVGMYFNIDTHTNLLKRFNNIYMNNDNIEESLIILIDKLEWGMNIDAWS